MPRNIINQNPYKERSLMIKEKQTTWGEIAAEKGLESRGEVSLIISLNLQVSDFILPRLST